MNQVLHKRARVPKGKSKKKRAARPDRESRLWERGKKAVAGLPPMPPGVSVTDVSDRGSDISEYICHEVAAGRQFIARSQHNRKPVGDGGEPLARKLHDRLRSLPPVGQYIVRVPADEGGWREAAVAWERVRLLPPRQARGEHGREPVEVWGVIAREVSPPAGVKPVEWVLLTNRRVESLEQALEVVEDYACRRVVEDYHKAMGRMKTGCGIEQLQSCR
jgi:hypothetical protein